MKTILTDYTFNASAHTIVFNDSILLEQLLLITNVTSGIIIYNFSNPAMGGTIVGNTLTLDYNTGSMSNSDDLQIFIIPVNADQDQVANDIRGSLNEIVRLLSLMRNDGGMADSAGRVRVNIDTGTLPTVTTLTTCTTCSTVSNITAAGSIQMGPGTIAQMNNSLKFNRQYITIT